MLQRGIGVILCSGRNYRCLLMYRNLQTIALSRIKMITQSGFQVKCLKERPCLRPPCQSSLLTTWTPLIQNRATFFDDVTVSKLPKTDPKKGDLVYVGKISKLVKIVKSFSISTSLLGLACQPYLLMQAANIEFPFIIKMFVGGMVNFFIFLTPALLHWFTKRYVTKIYYDPVHDYFTATTYTLFIREKELSFRSSEIKMMDLPGVMTSVIAKDKPLFVDPTEFMDKQAMLRFMRYSEPLEFEMPTQQTQPETHKSESQSK